jgi:uncharacterized membrane protein HdeD (DUF308 family)
MNLPWYWIAAALMSLTAVVHSVLGEVRLIRPLMKQRDGMLQHDLARRLLRGSWHFLGILMVGCGIVIAFPQTPDMIVMLIGVTWLAAGIVDVIYTRGKHVGWPLLVLAGLAAVIGAS